MADWQYLWASPASRSGRPGICVVGQKGEPLFGIVSWSGLEGRQCVGCIVADMGSWVVRDSQALEGPWPELLTKSLASSGPGRT